MPSSPNVPNEPARARSLFLPALILALGLAVGSWLLGGPVRAFVQSRQTISVKGYAETRLNSDFAIWSATVTTRGSDISSAADQMDKNVQAVVDFLVGQGTPRESILVSDLTTTAVNRTKDGTDTGQVGGFKLDRRVTVSFTDMDRASKLAAAAPQLLRAGIEISFDPLAYYCTRLADLKVSMLGDAVVDARHRADSIAAKSGRHLGPLHSASQGVFQITSVYETETSDYGALDTQSREKSMRAVVNAEFELR